MTKAQQWIHVRSCVDTALGGASPTNKCHNLTLEPEQRPYNLSFQPQAFACWWHPSQNGHCHHLTRMFLTLTKTRALSTSPMV